MEIIPQKDYCPVEPEAKVGTIPPEPKRPETPVSKTTNSQPVGVVPPDLPNQAQMVEGAKKTEKTSLFLVLLVMILLAVSSGLGYLIVTNQARLFFEIFN